jgi:hypothetical protein
LAAEDAGMLTEFYFEASAIAGGVVITTGGGKFRFEAGKWKNLTTNGPATDAEIEIINQQRLAPEAATSRVLSAQQLDAYARNWAKAVRSNQPYQWADIAPSVSKRQRGIIRNYAREKGYVPTAPVDALGNADFTGFIRRLPNGRLLDNVQLPRELWRVPQGRQERFLNSLFNYGPNVEVGPNGTPVGYTWHHTSQPGRMQLVEYGIHEATEHSGGRAIGGWAQYP